LSADPLFKPLLANFALFATSIFMDFDSARVHDQVDLILPSEPVLCPVMNATWLGKLMKLIKTRLGETPFSISIPSEQSLISEQGLKYLISGVSSLRTSCEQSPLFSLAQAKLQTMRAAWAGFYRLFPFHSEPGTGSSLKSMAASGQEDLAGNLVVLPSQKALFHISAGRPAVFLDSLITYPPSSRVRRHLANSSAVM
jgi:hypothetical protein